ncbi:unnamed protein product [Auanema sp. JU1783]|nr:unnamed protein product [Auanema sp. JU1783]
MNRGVFIFLHLVYLSSSLRIGEGVGPNFPPAAYNPCSYPQQVYYCYVSYLEKYGIRPINGQLPYFSQLEKVLRYDLDFINVCRDYDDLDKCLSGSDLCISVESFSLFTMRDASYPEAVAYLQSYAIMEYACGEGRMGFIDNSVCMTANLRAASLPEQMHRCMNQDIAQSCDLARQMVDCVKTSMTTSCGYVAGVVSCGAATNILRLEKDVDGFCLLDLTHQCNSHSLLIFLFPFTFTIFLVL